jgi:hypothetical protein
MLILIRSLVHNKKMQRLPSHTAYMRSSFTSYTECPRRNVPDFGRVFLMLKYTDIIQNTYVKS